MVYIVLFRPVCLLCWYSRQKAKAEIDFRRSRSRSRHRSQITCQCGVFWAGVKCIKAKLSGAQWRIGSFISANTSPLVAVTLCVRQMFYSTSTRVRRDVQTRSRFASPLWKIAISEVVLLLSSTNVIYCADRYWFFFSFAFICRVEIEQAWNE